MLCIAKEAPDASHLPNQTVPAAAAALKQKCHLSRNPADLHGVFVGANEGSPYERGAVTVKAVTERFEHKPFDNLAVICFANAASPCQGRLCPLRRGHQNENESLTTSHH